MPEKLLPGIRVKVRVDDSELRRAQGSSGVLGKSIKTSLDQTATPAIQRAQKATKDLNLATTQLTTTQTKHKAAATAASKAEHDLAKEGSSAARALGEMGDRGATVVERFTSLAGVMSSSGPMGIAIGAGILGLGLLTAGVEDGEQKYLDLANAVHEYSAVTGESTEASSRQLQAFQMLGVNADTAQLGMLRLARQIDLQPKKFEALGVVIARTSDGNVDLNKTLMNVADAYTHTSDAGQRAALVYEAFGRAGISMIPILDAGAKGLKTLEDQVNLVFTPQNVADARKYSIEQGILKEQLNELQESFGNFATGPQRAVTEGYLAHEYAIQKVRAQVGPMTLQMAELGGGTAQQAAEVNKLTNKYEDQYKASINAMVATQEQTDAMNSQSQAAQDLAKADDQLWSSTTSLFQAQLSYSKDQENVAGFADDYTKKQIDLSNAQIDVTQRTQDVKDAVDKYGSKSIEARKAVNDLASAQLSLRDANRQLQGSLTDEESQVLQNALAYVAMQQQLAVVNDKAYTAQQKQADFKTALENVRSELDPNAPLTKGLNSYIDTLEKQLPPELDTKITASISLALQVSTKLMDAKQAALDQRLGQQFGGIVVPNRDYLVGERGPEIVRFPQQGQVIPNPVDGGRAPGGSSIQLNNTFNAAGMSAWDVAREIGWQLRGLR